MVARIDVGNLFGRDLFLFDLLIKILGAERLDYLFLGGDASDQQGGDKEGEKGVQSEPENAAEDGGQADEEQ